MKGCEFLNISSAYTSGSESFGRVHVVLRIFNEILLVTIHAHAIPAVRAFAELAEQSKGLSKKHIFLFIKAE